MPKIFVDLFPNILSGSFRLNVYHIRHMPQFSIRSLLLDQIFD